MISPKNEWVANMTGGVLSSTVTVCVKVAVLPLSLVAVQVRTMMRPHGLFVTVLSSVTVKSVSQASAKTGAPNGVSGLVQSMVVSANGELVKYGTGLPTAIVMVSLSTQPMPSSKVTV